MVSMLTDIILLDRSRDDEEWILGLEVDGLKFTQIISKSLNIFPTEMCEL